MGPGARFSRFWQARTSWQPLGLFCILIVGAALRLYGVNWDEGHWLHPDERQIYFVTLELGWPRSLAEALTPDSPLNPGFFAYGSLPFYVLKGVAAVLMPLWPALRDSDNLHLVGRPLAVLFDLGTVYLTYRLARILWPKTGLRAVGLLAAGLVALAVLPIQLAHFYTTDTLLTFFVMLTLNLAADTARGAGRLRQVAIGVALGLAMATKVSTALLLVVVFAAYSVQCARSKAQGRSAGEQLTCTFLRMMPSLIVAGAVFFLVQPYALIDWQTFLGDTIRESEIAWGRFDVPYTRQYAGTIPYLYSIWQTALWGLAVPLGIVTWAALGGAVVRWLRTGPWEDTLLLAWAVPYLAITGMLYTRYLRYMLPLVPVLCILAAYAVVRIRRRWISGIVYVVLGIGVVVYLVSFLGIYAERHSWMVASEWIYQNVPSGSTLAVEEWDLPLPLALEFDGQSRRITEYDLRTLPLYDEPDDPTKWGLLAEDLASSDYAIIASRRLYGSIPRLPERYPAATRYYDRLFAGELGFALVREFTRGPGWLNPLLPPLPDAAPGWLRPDESFVVYDHPRALVFHNKERLPAAELLRRLQ